MFAIDSTGKDNKLVDAIKDKSSTIIDFFLNRQERLLPKSIKGGFSLFNALYKIICMHTTQCADIIEMLKSKGVTKDHVSLCNWICFNAYTKEYHQDNDSSYSMICVPYVNRKSSPVYYEQRGRYAFSFNWDNKNDTCPNISFQLDQGTSVYFLGPSCSHRQQVIEDGLFLNFSSYHNKRLYSNMKNSIKRCIV